MIKLTKPQKDQLIGIAVGTVVLVGALYYLGVTDRQDALSNTEKNTAKMMDTLKMAEGKIRQGEEIAEKLATRTQLLDKRESTLVPDRDSYAWILSTLNDFIRPRKGVNVISVNPPEVGESGILAGFPYKWATFHLVFSGYYHDMGVFIADLENNFPYFRVQNLAVSANTTVGTEAEKLTVSFDLVAPVKPSETK
jgi:hypothetical protein